MGEFTQYRRKELAELRPYIEPQVYAALAEFVAKLKSGEG